MIGQVVPVVDIMGFMAHGSVVRQRQIVPAPAGIPGAMFRIVLFQNPLKFTTLPWTLWIDCGFLGQQMMLDGL